MKIKMTASTRNIVYTSPKSLTTILTINYNNKRDILI